MKIGEYQIIGMQKVTSKSGNQGTKFWVSTPFQDFEINNNAFGLKTDTLYVKGWKDFKVGDIVSVLWGRNDFTKEAMIQDIILVQASK